jgi:two-component sensor histidine kinase
MVAAVFVDKTSSLADWPGAVGDAVRPWWFTIAKTLHSLPVWAQHGLTICVVVLSFLLRDALVGGREAYPYVFFMPAILIASTVLTHGSGVVAVVLSAILIKSLLIPLPFSPWFAQSDDLVAITVFLASGMVTALMGGALHKALFQLAGAYERIAASENQKALLHDEIIHRFKNDLANLTAILRLQAKDTSDPLARTELLIASDRVNVLSRLHQRLNGSPDHTCVDVSEFLSELCKDLRVAAVGTRPILLHTELEPAELPFEAAISVGLIVNELIQNAIKYAFPNNRAGQITVGLRRCGDRLRLTVADDGVGFTSPSPTGSGLGQRLIGSFAQQLGGTFDVRSGQGHSAVVAFPAPSPKMTPSGELFERSPEYSDGPDRALMVAGPWVQPHGSASTTQ